MDHAGLTALWDSVHSRVRVASGKQSARLLAMLRASGTGGTLFTLRGSSLSVLHQSLRAHSLSTPSTIAGECIFTRNGARVTEG